MSGAGTSGRLRANTTAPAVPSADPLRCGSPVPAGVRGAYRATDAYVVVEIAPDARKLRDDGNPEPLQVLCGADTREQQELRRPYGARGEKHLPPCGHGDGRAAVVPVGDTRGAAALDDDPGDVGSGHDPQVRAGPRGGEERVREGDAMPVPHREAQGVDALGAFRVPLCAGQTQPLCGTEQSFGQRVFGSGADGQRAPSGPRAVVLQPAEGRSGALPGPALAVGTPGVVVRRAAGNPQRRVDGGRTAERAARGPGDGPSAESGLRHGVVGPVGVRAPQLGAT